MKNGLRLISPLVGLLLLYGSGYAQRGPGGVSHDTFAPTQSDNRLWLKAGSLTNLADGENVYVWDDISPSAINDQATNDVNDDFLPPYFRDDPSASINGHPVVTFGEGRMLKIESSNDLNTEVTTTYEQTIVMAFRTSDDVTSRQVLWEEGGGQRGMNAYISDGELYLGAYDKQHDPDNVPLFGYTYVKTAVQPNTTYVLSHLFYANPNNTLSGGYVKGYRNGSEFGTMFNNGDFFPPGAKVGGVYRHPNQIGVGAVNSGSYMHTGNQGDNTGHVVGTGSYPFLGRLAEICYYNRLLNDAERIIIENYLGAKYYANNIVNDKYAHQGNYSHEVIGIGQTVDAAAQRHTVSQGTNPFEISADNESNSFNAPNEFLLVGHNGASMNLTEDNTPNDSSSTKRTFRIWRFDESGELDKIKFRFTGDELPPLPAGYSKYVAIFDETSPNFPDFTSSTVRVKELKDVGGGVFEMKHDVVDGSFMTIGVLKPQVGFRDAESFAVEGTPPDPAETTFYDLIYLRLNYVPETPVTVDLTISDGTALRYSDYNYTDAHFDNGVTFPPGSQEIPVLIRVVNDTIAEDPSIEYCTLDLVIGGNTTAGLGLGGINQHVFSIYDDDPPPKASFSLAASNVNESAGTHTVEILRTGTSVNTEHVSVRVVPSLSTAIAGEDFVHFPATTVYFAPGESSKTIELDIIDDVIDEFDETITLRLVGPASLGLDANSNEVHTVTIVDDDLPSVAGFAAAYSQNHETYGNPSILIELDRPSAKEVTVYYTKTENLATAATYDEDYTLSFPGVVNIPAGDTLANPVSFIVDNDGVPEDDETVEFLLTGADNATLSDETVHVYTIKDYSAFEWKGAGGVGKDSDDILWVEAERQSGSNNTSFSSLTNFSPHNIEINAPSSSKEAKLRTVDSFLNGKKTFKFDGNNDVYEIDNSGLINRANFNSKAVFFALRTGGDVQTRQTLFKQGFHYRGMVVYIENGRLYLHVVNHHNDPSLKWGYNGSPGSARYAYFDGLTANTDYVISCFFDNNHTKKIRVYVNGVEGQRSETGSCGTFILHGTVSLGGVEGSTRYHDGSTNNTGSFGGNLAEFLYFSDAPVTESRRIILENYLAVKYAITLNDNAIGPVSSDFHYAPAGIGQVDGANNDLHTDAQGHSILRIKSPLTISDDSFLFWAHNNRPLEESWPWSTDYLPAGIMERSGRVWSVNKTGNIDQVEVLLDYSDLKYSPDFNINELKLLVHQNSDPQDFSDATVHDAESFMSGEVVKFAAVHIPDNSYFSLASSSTVTPLPIELLNFDAELKTGAVDLVWRTATEQNSDYFTVQRSADLKIWEPIAQTPAAGHSQHTITYREKDRMPLPGVSYYRLKQVDIDGAVAFSHVVSVFNAEPTGGDNLLVYPNPVKGPDAFLILPRHLLKAPISIQVYDLLGRSMWVSSEQEPEDVFKIPVHGLQPGLYIIQVRSALINESTELIVE